MADGRLDRRMSLVGPGEFKRKMIWGEKWKRLRIGLLLRINGGSTITGDFAFGVCSGITNGVGSATCTNFIGATTRPGNTNQYTFAAGSDVGVFTATFAGGSSKRVNTFTDYGGVSSMKGYPATGSSALCINMLDIKRGRLAASATYSMFVQGPTGSGTAAGSAEQFLDWGTLLQAVSEVDTTSPSGWWYDGAASTNSGTFDESAGALDSINVWWSHASTAIEIAGIAVMKAF